MKPATQGTKWTMMIGGALMLGGPSLGVAGTVLGMIRSFDVLGRSEPVNPEVLAGEIGTNLLSTAGGMVVGIIGLIVFLTGLISWLVRKDRVTPPPLPPR